MQKRVTGWKPVLHLRVWCTVVCLWLVACPVELRAQPWKKKRATTVVVAPVTQGELKSTLYLVGTAFPLITTTISAQVEGNIEKFKVNEGTFVKKNEVICQLDKTLKLIAVKRDKSFLEQARAELSKLKAVSRLEEINRAQAQMENRQAILEKLKLNKERMNDLFSKGMATLEDKQNAFWDHRQGLAQLDEAQALYDLAVEVEESRDGDIMAAEAKIATRQAELERSEELLSKTGITVPFKGVIVNKHKEVGEWIDEGEALVDIINIEKILVHAGISERDVAQVMVGLPAQISFDAYPNSLFKGIVKEVIPQANTQSRTFPVKIEVDNKDHKLYAGMFARITLQIGKSGQALLVPKDAVIKAGDIKYLFTVKDSVVRKVKVEVGREKGDLIEVEGKIQVGDKVVVTNNEILKDKAQVKVVQGK